jgi:PST family polysaccharide transporter
MEQNFISKGVTGSVYNISVSVVTMVLGFLRATLLMRLIPDPDAFGIIALSMFFSTITVPFSVLGLDSNLIQKKDPTPASFSTHFILRIGLSIILLLVGLAVSPILRNIYQDQTLMVDFFVIFLGLNVFNASYSTQGVILRRNLRYGSIALLNLSASIFMTIIAPLSAYFGAGIWSIFLEQATGNFVRWIGLWLIIRPWKPSFQFDVEDSLASIKFGIKVLSSNLLGIILDRFDDFWAGTYLGSTPLGYYSRAYDLVQYPERVLATPITNVFFSMYAVLQEKKIELSKAFFRSSSFLVRVGFYIGVILFCIAPEITVILYTDVWLPIVPVFRIMLVYLFLNPLYNNLSSLMVGVGHPVLLVRTRSIQVVVFFVSVISFSMYWGLNGIAVAANLMIMIGTIILLIYTKNIVRVSYKRMFLWPSVALFSSLSVGMLTINLLRPGNIWQGIIVKILIISTVYLPILLIAERDIILDYGRNLLRPFINKIREENISIFISRK